MNQEELIDYMFKNTDVAKKDARILLKIMVVEIQKTLRRGGAVTITGLGIFKVYRKEATVVRNPKTQALMTVPSKKAVRFVVAGALKNAAEGA